MENAANRYKYEMGERNANKLPEICLRVCLYMRERWIYIYMYLYIYRERERRERKKEREKERVLGM